MTDFSIVGSDGYIISGEESQVLTLLGMADEGSMDPMVVLGAAMPLLARIQSRPGGATPLASTLASRLNILRNRLGTQGAGPIRLATGPALTPSGPGPIREVVQGLDSGAVAIAAGAQAVITFNATMIYRPTRLMIGPDVAGFWVVDDFRVSADSLFLSAGAVPAQVFLPESVGASALKRRTAQPGTPVSVLVTNVDAVAHRFRGSVFGEGSDIGSC